ncbi:hypothetical protein ABIC03_007579 [Bradyrhizobium sp. RT6a]
MRAVDRRPAPHRAWHSVLLVCIEDKSRICATDRRGRRTALYESNVAVQTERRVSRRRQRLLSNDIRCVRNTVRLLQWTGSTRRASSPLCLMDCMKRAAPRIQFSFSSHCLAGARHKYLFGHVSAGYAASSASLVRTIMSVLPPELPCFIAVRPEETPFEDPASVRHTSRTYSFPVSGFRETAFAIEAKVNEMPTSLNSLQLFGGICPPRSIGGGS